MTETLATVCLGQVGSHQQAFSDVVGSAKVTYFLSLVTEDKKNRFLCPEPFCGILQVEFPVVVQEGSAFVPNGKQEWQIFLSQGKELEPIASTAHHPLRMTSTTRSTSSRTIFVCRGKTR